MFHPLNDMADIYLSPIYTLNQLVYSKRLWKLIGNMTSEWFRLLVNCSVHILMYGWDSLFKQNTVRLKRKKNPAKLIRRCHRWRWILYFFLLKANYLSILMTGRGVSMIESAILRYERGHWGQSQCHRSKHWELWFIFES